MDNLVHEAQYDICCLRVSSWSSVTQQLRSLHFCLQNVFSQVCMDDILQMWGQHPSKFGSTSETHNWGWVSACKLLVHAQNMFCPWMDSSQCDTTGKVSRLKGGGEVTLRRKFLSGWIHFFNLVLDSRFTQFINGWWGTLVWKAFKTSLTFTHCSYTCTQTSRPKLRLKQSRMWHNYCAHDKWGHTKPKTQHENHSI